MDFSQLPQLGKVAGVPGIALGVAAVLLGAVAESTGVLPESWRGPVTVTIVIGAVALALLALLAWSRSVRPGAMIGRSVGDNSSIQNIDKTKTKTGGTQIGESKGANSPVVNLRE